MVCARTRRTTSAQRMNEKHGVECLMNIQERPNMDTEYFPCTRLLLQIAVVRLRDQREQRNSWLAFAVAVKEE